MMTQEKMAVGAEEPATLKSKVTEEDAASVKDEVASIKQVASIKPSVSKTASAEAHEAASVGKASSSLMDREDEDDVEAMEAEHLIVEEPKTNYESSSLKKEAPPKKKQMGLAGFLRLGAACSMNPSTPVEFNMDRVKDDVSEGASKKAIDDDAAPTSPEGLLSWGVDPNARKDGVFHGLTNVHSDIALCDPSLIEEDEMRTLTKQISRSVSREKEEIKMETNEFEDDEPHRRMVSPTPPAPETREAKVKKSKSKEDKPHHRAAPATEKKETKVKKSKSKEDKPHHRAAPAPEKKETKVKKSKSKEDKPSHLASPVSQESTEKKTLGRSAQTELVDELVPQITLSHSSILLEASSSVTEDTFVGHMEAKFDLYHQKFGLIQKFGTHLDQLKKKQGKFTYSYAFCSIYHLFTNIYLLLFQTNS